VFAGLEVQVGVNKLGELLGLKINYQLVRYFFNFYSTSCRDGP